MLCLRGWGFLYECPLHCPTQLGGSLGTICLPSLHPAAVGSALLPWALPYSHGLHPVSVGSALLSWAPSCWRSLSVIVGCLGSGRLCQQWECTSVGAECLGSGGRPSPTKLQCPGFSCARSETLNPERFKSLFYLSLWGWDPPSLLTWLPASGPFLSLSLSFF